MNPIMRITGLALLGLSLTACFDGGSSRSSSRGSTVQDPVVTEAGSDFIVAELENTTDDRDAVNIDNLEFKFNDQQAIDALF